MNKWKAGVIIRNKLTGKPFKVLHSYAGTTFIYDLTDKSTPIKIQGLLERDYDDYEDEQKLQMIQKKRDSWFDTPEIIWI